LQLRGWGPREEKGKEDGKGSRGGEKGGKGRGGEKGWEGERGGDGKGSVIRWLVTDLNLQQKF